MTEEVTLEPQGIRERITEGRFKWVALALLVLVAAVYAVGYFGWEDEIFPDPVGYPSAAQNDVRGFYSGSQVDGVLFFTFFGTRDQPSPLIDYRTLHTDEIHVVSYAPDLRELTLRVETWREQGLENRTVITDQVSWEEKIYPRGFEFSTIRIPTSSEYQEVRITYEGEVIWRGGHETNDAYIEAGSRTHGEIARDRAIFMIFSLVVVLMGFAAVKRLYDAVKVVPELPTRVAFLAVIVFLAFFAAGVYWLVENYAVRQIWWMGVPIFVSSFSFGIWMLRPKYDTWFFLEMEDIEGRPWADIMVAEVAYDNDLPLLAKISWIDFLRGRRRRILVETDDRDPQWYYPVEGETNDRLYYVQDQRYDSHGYRVKLAGIHHQRIEEFKAGLVAEESTAAALSRMTKRAVRAEADLEKKAIEHGSRMARDYIEEILVAMKVRKREQEKDQD